MKKRISVIIAVVAIFAATGHAQTVYQKDRWGAPVYYFDFIPDRWQIACLILM